MVRGGQIGQASGGKRQPTQASTAAASWTQTLPNLRRNGHDPGVAAFKNDMALTERDRTQDRSNVNGNGIEGGLNLSSAEMGCNHP